MIVNDLHDSQDPKHTLFCRKNAFVAIYSLFQTTNVALVAEKGQCHLLFTVFFYCVTFLRQCGVIRDKGTMGDKDEDMGRCG